jgi:hypothetical protein
MNLKRMVVVGKIKKIAPVIIKNKKMKINVSGTERFIRIMLGLMLITLFFFGIFGAFWGYTTLLTSLILLGTGIMGNCPIYSLLDMAKKK